jgi:L-alanine-DL-glutamate epimerase-like enolase superfamily enzyme
LDWYNTNILETNVVPLATLQPQHQHPDPCQVKANDGYVTISDSPGIGVTPDEDFIARFELTL